MSKMSNIFWVRCQKRRFRNHQLVAIKLTLSSQATKVRTIWRRLHQKNASEQRFHSQGQLQEDGGRLSGISPSQWIKQCHTKLRRIGCTHCNSWCFGPSCELLHLSLEDSALVSLPKTLQWRITWTSSGCKTKISVQEKAPTAAKVEYQNSSQTITALTVVKPCLWQHTSH